MVEEWVQRQHRTSTSSVHVAAEHHRARVAQSRVQRAPRQGRRINVAFRRAPLSEALRLLAEEARLNLVIADDVSGEVSLHLRAVRPYDAMLALAQAHGAELARQGNVIFVRSR